MTIVNQNFEIGEIMKRILLNPIGMFISGALLGIISKLLDIYTQNLGNIFSQFSIWILLGTLIAIFSKNKKCAMLNIFPFCIGMLITYYIVAELTNSVYGKSFIIGWLIFSMFSPIFAYFTWLTKNKGTLPKIISMLIIMFTLLASIVIFSGPRIYDILIIILLIYFLFFYRIRRNT